MAAVSRRTFPLRELSPSRLRSSRDLIHCQPVELMFSQHLWRDFRSQQETKRLGGVGGEGSERETESGRSLRKAEMKMSLKEFNVSPQDARVLNY